MRASDRYNAIEVYLSGIFQMKHEWQKTTELEYSDTRGQQEQSVLVEYDTKFECQRCGQIFRTGPGSRGVQFFMREQECKGEES